VDVTWLLIVGLFIAVNVGMWFYVKGYNRRPSEYQKAYEDLAESFDDVKTAIGEALLPIFTQMVEALQDIVDTFQRKDRK
jgi:hypothetical protein